MDSIAEAIRSADDFAITAHVLPDGDAAGSVLAFRHLLTRLGKRSEILLPCKLPRKFDFLARDVAFHTYPDDWDLPEIQRLRNLIVLDCSALERLGPLAEQVPRAFDRVVCLDHHLCDAAFATVKHVDSTASSTAELIWDLATDRLGISVDRTLAAPLYVALACETGSFHYGNTSPKVHRIVADLLETGIAPEEMYGLLYERNTIDSLRLRAEALDRLEFEADGRLAWIGLPPEVFRRYRVAEEETAGLVTLARSVEGVQIAILLYEDVPGAVKISFRSKSDTHDVNALARAFGGGGHVRAAGALVQGSLEQVAPRVVAAASDTLTASLSDSSA